MHVADVTRPKLETAYACLCFSHARQVYSSPHRDLTRLYQPPDSSQALTLAVEILPTFFTFQTSSLFAFLFFQELQTAACLTSCCPQKCRSLVYTPQQQLHVISVPVNCVTHRVFTSWTLYTSCTSCKTVQSIQGQTLMHTLLTAAETTVQLLPH